MFKKKLLFIQVILYQFEFYIMIDILFIGIHCVINLNKAID